VRKVKICLSGISDIEINDVLWQDLCCVSVDKPNFSSVLGLFDTVRILLWLPIDGKFIISVHSVSYPLKPNVSDICWPRNPEIAYVTQPRAVQLV
jgi:hypothetical protein